MQRRKYIQVSSLIVFLSILTIIAQFTLYYFVSSPYVVLGGACVIPFLCAHIILKKSGNYVSNFIYTILVLFVSFIVYLFTIYEKEQSFLPYTNLILAIVVLNWMIPSLHAFMISMFHQGRYEDFRIFHRNNSLLFLFFYIGILVYHFFSSTPFVWAQPTPQTTINFVPFLSLATKIEDYIFHYIPLSSVIMFVTSRMLFFIPYGYYTTILLRKKTLPIRILVYSLLPLSIELLQYYLSTGRCDIDDFIFGLLGSILGGTLFFFVNAIFRAFSGRDFLTQESDYRFSNSSLHF